MSKDIKAIITYLDNYLAQIGQKEIDPVQANAILATKGLLNDNKDRPGKPLRDLLRKGLLPHAFQAGGKGSSWTIPHSDGQKSKTIANNLTINIVGKGKGKGKGKEIIKSTQLLQIDSNLVEKALMDEEKYIRASDIDNIVPNTSGLYCIRISDIDKIPNPFNHFLADRQHNIIYMGIAKKSLKRRFLNQELRANGHGTFFRSIGAILGFRPLKGSLVAKKNKRNYKFSNTDEQKIINWINDNLVVNWIEYNDDFDALETSLIQKYKPLINISKNPSAIKELSDLRKICVQIANE